MPSRKKIKRIVTEHRPPLTLQRCHESGGKLRFRTETEASRELVECRIKYMFQRQAKRRESRVYQCEHCADWHLTAMRTPPKNVDSSPRNGDTMTQKDPRRVPPRKPSTSTPRPSSSGGSSSGAWESSFSSVDFGSSADSYDGGSPSGSSYDGGSSSSSCSSDNGSSYDSGSSGGDC